MNWKKKATTLYKEVIKRELWNDELANTHYTGAGGCVHPNGKLMNSLPSDDVAWESLYFDCQYILKT